MENPLWMEVLIATSLINGPFSIAMFDYQRVVHKHVIYRYTLYVRNSEPVEANQRWKSHVSLDAGFHVSKHATGVVQFECGSMFLPLFEVLMTVTVSFGLFWMHDSDVFENTRAGLFQQCGSHCCFMLHQNGKPKWKPPSVHPNLPLGNTSDNQKWTLAVPSWEWVWFGLMDLCPFWVSVPQCFFETACVSWNLRKTGIDIYTRNAASFMISPIDQFISQIFSQSFSRMWCSWILNLWRSWPRL